MKKTAIVLALLATAGSAAAQSGLLHVPNKVALAHASSTLKTIIRDGYLVAGDAPPVEYVASGSACSLNTGAGDGGSQVPTSDSKCWIANFTAGGADIREWGVACDAADNTLTAQQALNWTRANNKLLLPCMVGVQNHLTLGNGTSTSASTTNQNFVIEGLSGAGIYDEFVGLDVPGSGFKYTGAGALSGSLLTLLGPIVGDLNNVQIDGAYKVDVCLYAYNLTSAWNKNTLFAHCNTAGVRLDAYPTITSVFTGANDNHWDNFFITMQGTGSLGATGLDIGFSSWTGAGPGLDVARNHFHTGYILMPAASGDAAITLRGTDLDTFDGVFTYSTGGAAGAYGVAVAPPTGATFLPSSITFVNSPLVGGVYVGAGWTCDTGSAGEGLTFFGLPTGDMVAKGRPVPFGKCIHGFTNNGTAISQYQTLNRYDATRIAAGISTLDRSITSQVVVNTTTPTSIYSYTLPANALSHTAPDNGAVSWDRYLVVTCTGAVKNSTGSDQTIDLTLSFGGTTVADTGAVTMPTGAGFRAWSISTKLYAFGAKNSQRTSSSAQIGAVFSGGAPGSVMLPTLANQNGAISGLTLDASTALAVAASIRFGAADANLTATKDACWTELH